MDQTLIYVISALLSLLVMVGIALMSKVRYASLGNSLSALAILAGIVFTLLTKENNGTPIITAWSLYPSLAIGALIGGLFATRVKMIQMPQLVALLNGLGGGASALVGILSVAGIGERLAATAFSNFTGYLAIGIGLITLVGSLVAAGKLHRLLPQKPQVWAFHSMATVLSLVVMAILILIGTFSQYEGMPVFWLIAGVAIFSSLFGLYFSIRVGGADMPITISLLNSLSGVAGAIAGMAIGDVLLVAVGGIVGASGLLLTQIMCRAMNRSLLSILLGTKKKVAAPAPSSVATASSAAAPKVEVKKTPGEVLSTAKRVIIVPGYGMALAQAQHEVKHLADALRKGGAEVRFAIHPVAGRMPGHMNVLLAEANVPYDDLFEMEAINDDFAKVDAAIVIGANDVLNPAARNAEGTPIYGMPVLNVDQAPFVVICNYDLKPGYAGVENPLYTREEGVTLLTGDAKETVSALLADYQKALAGNGAAAPKTEANDKPTVGAILSTAKRVIIVPGYGMALAQAQHEVKQLADKLRSKGAEVRFAIHPVAGRMPGHMNVLLAEANVPYEDLFEMEAINDDFAKVDAAIVIGANDVLNPAARNAEGTPIYGMPVLNVDQAPYVVICNYDLKPGYAGVENPLYTREEGVALLTGDAKESLARLMEEMDQIVTPEGEGAKKSCPSTPSYTQWMKEARKVIIVPGYGMALAQAQHEVKQLADKLAKQGAEVRFAIHPVAGRMPGHMNVLLAEANVPYDDLFEMEAINNDFASTDLVIVIGANDVLNPAARDAEGTPIYGMPVLNVDQAPHVIICNYDLKPGYAGVENPLYTREEGVALLTGDAKESLQKLLAL
ncbi:NAD(P)(+) transhydrogenase (Re/Si-specific) subunit beta [Porphyromonas endodontalis]|uniref:NAD(P)(+) transhydrogenase (Re/Si-specific) subunit beta n=1 Tax=Porphyromonas endodontalis TaxID=28124 RepID=UPI0028ED7888|nr:NAD(P)(+) transhydrogenase (Re/Si-specific) subunit beta [Porphyromonas endodontalis]